MLALSVEILPVTPEIAEGAAKALAQAFLLEPVTDVFFPPSEGRKLEKLRALFGWAIRYRLLAGLPAYVAFKEGRVVGACTLRVPNQVLAPETEALWDEAAPIIGKQADARLEEYDAIQKKNLPERPHHYLVAIGVLPELHGRGIGGKLLQAAIELAEADSFSNGIALDNASEANAGFYGRFGFEEYAREPFGSAAIRFLFRPNRAQP